MHFSEGGGYERREWWSRRGLGVEGGVRHHASSGRGGGRPASAAVCHVSWFEADAFARAHDARLPSEAEWERAATSGAGAIAEALARAWARCGSGRRAHFDGYPGFRAHPYREYSEVFFGDDYRVLRGGSWATPPARGDAHVPQLGPARSAARSSPGCGWRGTRDGARDAARAARRRSAIRIESHLDGGEERSLADDVLDGLTRPFKELPPKHFYDARGAELFDRICELPEYYPTRAERAILEDCAPRRSRR